MAGTFLLGCLLGEAQLMALEVLAQLHDLMILNRTELGGGWWVDGFAGFAHSHGIACRS